MAPSLLIGIRFPSGVYRGGDTGSAEPIPSPARLHAAFVSAASGGPDAGLHDVDGRVLVASEADREAVCWLERTPPLGMLEPPLSLVDYSAKRHRVRAAVDPKVAHDHHRNETGFEPFSSLGGPVVFAWPQPERQIQERLQDLARQITHVGRADSTAIVSVSVGEFDLADPQALIPLPGRGEGLELRVPEEGRFEALVAAHVRASALGSGRHAAGVKGPQATDVVAPGAGDAHTTRRRFAPARPEGPWPYSEVWRLPGPDLPRWATTPGRSVATAVAVHRGLVAAIGSEVPELVTGRAGGGPASGAGHLAIHVAGRAHGWPAEILIALPASVLNADRAQVLDVVSSGIPVRIGGRVIRLGQPEITSALSFWEGPAEHFATTVPMVLDAPGTPRRVPWTLDDSVICSVGYAMRGVLERLGVEWGSGWSFRQRLVSELRSRGVDARASRVHAGADRFVHHGRPGDLLVAVQAVVRLGDLAAGGRGLLAIGRSRHLGGGLLRPLRES